MFARCYLRKTKCFLVLTWGILPSRLMISAFDVRRLLGLGGWIARFLLVQRMRHSGDELRRYAQERSVSCCMGGALAWERMNA